jgi:hypothetical protein
MTNLVPVPICHLPDISTEIEVRGDVFSVKPPRITGKHVPDAKNSNSTARPCPMFDPTSACQRAGSCVRHPRSAARGC